MSHAGYERGAALQQEVTTMTYVASAAAFADAIEIEFELPAIRESEADWAARNPARAMALLYVAPSEGAVLDAMLAG